MTSVYSTTSTRSTCPIVTLLAARLFCPCPESHSNPMSAPCLRASRAGKRAVPLSRCVIAAAHVSCSLSPGRGHTPSHRLSPLRSGHLPRTCGVDGARRVEGAGALAGGRGQRRPPSRGWSEVECGDNGGKTHVDKDGEQLCARI